MGDEGSNGVGHVEGFDESDDLDVVEFIDHEGKRHVVAVLAVVEVDDLDYAVLAPVEQLRDDDCDTLEIFLFHYAEDENGDEMFAYIEDEATFLAVQRAAEQILGVPDTSEIEPAEA